jgi:hypothetical protein
MKTARIELRRKNVPHLPSQHPVKDPVASIKGPVSSSKKEQCATAASQPASLCHYSVTSVPFLLLKLK